MKFPLFRKKFEHNHKHIPNKFLIIVFVFVGILFLFSVITTMSFNMKQMLLRWPLVGKSLEVDNTQKVDDYRKTVKPIVGVLLNTNFSTLEKDKIATLLEGARANVLAVTRVPAEFKSVHLFVVITLDKIISKVKSGEPLTGDEFLKEFKTLYEGL